MDAAEQKRLQGLIQDQERLYAFMDELRDEAMNMQRLVSMKRDEGVQKQRYLQGAEKRHSEVKSYLTIQELELIDNRKKLQILQVIQSLGAFIKFINRRG